MALARSAGDGSTREIHLRGGGRLQETILAAKAPEVHTYRVDVVNALGARAIAEEWRLAPAGTGTRLRRTFAVDGTAAFRVVARPGRAGPGRTFRDAVRSPDRWLAVQSSWRGRLDAWMPGCPKACRAADRAH